MYWNQAVTILFAVILMVTGFGVPVAAPVQFLNCA